MIGSLIDEDVSTTGDTRFIKRVHLFKKNKNTLDTQ